MLCAPAGVEAASEGGEGSAGNLLTAAWAVASGTAGRSRGVAAPKTKEGRAARAWGKVGQEPADFNAGFDGGAVPWMAAVPTGRDRLEHGLTAVPPTPIYDAAVSEDGCHPVVESFDFRPLVESHLQDFVDQVLGVVQGDSVAGEDLVQAGLKPLQGSGQDFGGFAFHAAVSSAAARSSARSTTNASGLSMAYSRRKRRKWVARASV